jgi:ferritin
MENANVLKRSLKTEASVSNAVNTSKIAKPKKGKRNPLISEDAIDHLNYRIQQEEYSSRIYLSMSMWLENKGYVNAAKLWKKYSTEELAHSDWARKYLLSFGVQPATPPLNAPDQDYDGLPQIIELSYEHEIDITMQIKEFASKALAAGDHQLYELSLMYLKEQVDEHDKTQNWMDQLESFGTDKIAMRLLDHEMKDYL